LEFNINVSIILQLMIKLPVATLTVLTCISEYIKIITIYGGWGVLLDSYYHLSLEVRVSELHDCIVCKD
jgi:hypothetical protein